MGAPLSDKKRAEENSFGSGDIHFYFLFSDLINCGILFYKDDLNLPLKKSFAQKIFGLNPSASLGTGLTLHAREARGVAEIQWAAIEAAHQKNSKTDVCLIAVSIYNTAWTYFTKKI